jgi:hypothetical protein
MHTGTEPQGNPAAPEAHHHDRLRVVVHYAAAAHPFEEKAKRSETVGLLKEQVLKAFHLHEGKLPDGNTVTYTLYHHKRALENLSETLGQVAGEHAEELVLKLSQQITQG